MRRERDSQRSKVWRVLEEMVSSPCGDSLNDCASFAQKVLSYSAVRRRLGNNTGAMVRDRVRWLGGRPVTRPGHYTKLSRDRFREHRVLFHLAFHVQHFLVEGDLIYRDDAIIPYRAQGIRADDAAWHGWQFCHIWYLLVRYGMGKDAGDLLLSLFAKHKVRHRPKQKREATPAQLEALRKARMAKNADLIEERWKRARQKKRGIEL